MKELRTFFSNTEPSTNAIWLQRINDVLTQKVYTENGWQIIGNADFDLPTYIEGIELEIGNTNEVKQSNLKKLRKLTAKTNVFVSRIDYGIGVGTWVNGNGGFTHVITAQGVEVYYNITKDGAVTIDETHVSPASLYGEYLAFGGTKSKEEFNHEIFSLIG